MFLRKGSGTNLAGSWDCFKKQSRPHSKFGTQKLASSTLGRSVVLPLPSTRKHVVQSQSPEEKKELLLHLCLLVLCSLIKCPTPHSPDAKPEEVPHRASASPL